MECVGSLLLQMAFRPQMGVEQKAGREEGKRSGDRKAGMKLAEW